MTLVLTNEEIERVLPMSVCVAALEDAYKEYARGEAVNSPRIDILAPSDPPGAEDVYYALKSMMGIHTRAGIAALRVNSDLVYWPTREGVLRREKVAAAAGERWVGFVILLDTRTGEPVALFPDGVIGRNRVGATNGLGAKALARPDARVLGLLGSGWEAQGQATAFCAVRQIELIKVYSPNREHCQEFARLMSERLDREVRPVDSAEEAVRDADIISSATNALDRMIQPEWLRPGVHASAIKVQEADEAVFDRCDVVVLHTTDHVKQQTYAQHRPGDEVPEVRPGWWSDRRAPVWQRLHSLSEVLAGQAPGRTDPSQVTFFMNNIGMGFQFAVVGAKLYELAKAAGLGHECPTEWFTQDVHS